MKISRPESLTFLILCALSFAPRAEAGNFCPPADAPKADLYPGAGAALRGSVHPAAVGDESEGLKCVVEGLKKIGLSVKTLWGYGCRPLRSSNHPRGLAVDVDQFARDQTRPVVPRQQGVQIANDCHVTSGAIWRDPDNGHFEIRSLSRREQASRVPKTVAAPRTPKVISDQRERGIFMFW